MRCAGEVLGYMADWALRCVPWGKGPHLQEGGGGHRPERLQIKRLQVSEARGQAGLAVRYY